MSAIKGGAQQDRILGGAQTIANKMAAILGDKIRLNSPVRSISQDAGGATIVADNVTVQAQQVIVAAPPFVASQISYSPPLPAQHMSLLQNLPGGAVIKAAVVYPTAFWRANGFSGQVAHPGAQVGMAIDGSGPTGTPGVLLAFASGPAAQTLGVMSAASRRTQFLNALTNWFGSQASSPSFYTDFVWQTEPWTLGCFSCYYAPGIMTRYGPTLRSIEGRIHFAGTETAVLETGYIEGAITSGERAVAEVLLALQAQQMLPTGPTTPAVTPQDQQLVGARHTAFRLSTRHRWVCRARRLRPPASKVSRGQSLTARPRLRTCTPSKRALPLRWATSGASSTRSATTRPRSRRPRPHAQEGAIAR
jgi:monoamine oxidase